MSGFEISMSVLMIVLIIAVVLILVFAALILVTAAANLILMLFKPITDPIQGIIEHVSETVPNPLDKIPLFPKIKRNFGSPKNILFICFVIIFLMIHYLSLGNLDFTTEEGIFPLFAETVLGQYLTAGTDLSELDISSFAVDPDSYLRIIIFSFVTGLFIHIGCTTKAPDAKIHILVQFLYIPLVNLFSSVVLGMIPPDMFSVSLSKISLDFTSTGIDPGDLYALASFAQLKELGAILLKNLWSSIPYIVAFYFLCRSICGFATTYLGGFFALLIVTLPVGILFPEALSDTGSLRKVVIFFFAAFSAGEVIALALSEIISKAADGLVDLVMLKLGNLFVYYNIVTLLISYFFYPALPVSILTLIGVLANDNNMATDPIIKMIPLACLLVFSLATFAEYKITKCLLEDGDSVDGKSFVSAMVFNVPVWILYIVVFLV